MSRLSIVHSRGGAFESEHPVAAVGVDASGRIIARFGGELVTTFRSAAKPFQLEASLETLDATTLRDLDEEELAIGAASHHGEEAHVALVDRLLARFDANVGDLRCGIHAPFSAEAARALLRSGQAPDARHNNCSGKHAFMLGACRAAGWREEYRAADHPLQRSIHALIHRRSGGAVERSVVDGCGVPCFVLSLRGMAQAYAAIAAAMRCEDEQGEPSARNGAASSIGRIAWAMQRHSTTMSGRRALDGHLISTATRPLVAKVGAEGLICVAIPEASAGLAIKVKSGSAEARAVAAHAILDRLFPGLVPMSESTRYGVVRDLEGRAVGERIAVFLGASSP